MVDIHREGHETCGSAKSPLYPPTFCRAFFHFLIIFVTNTAGHHADRLQNKKCDNQQERTGGSPRLPGVRQYGTLIDRRAGYAINGRFLSQAAGSPARQEMQGSPLRRWSWNSEPGEKKGEKCSMCGDNQIRKICEGPIKGQLAWGRFRKPCY